MELGTPASARSCSRRSRLWRNPLKTITWPPPAVRLRSSSTSVAAFSVCLSRRARPARSSQPTPASVGASAAGLDPAWRCTLRSARRRAGAASRPSRPTRSETAAYSSASSWPGVTRMVSARLATSPPSPSRWRARNWAGVPSRPGATRLTSWKRSSRRFSTGVAVSSSRCRVRRDRASRPEAVLGALRRWASSAMTTSHRLEVRTWRRGSRRAVANEASTTAPAPSSGIAPPGTPGPPRAMVTGRPNLDSSSSLHCSTRPAGTTTRARSPGPRWRSSARTMPASMVLPNPTSSARMARPRIRRRAALRSGPGGRKARSAGGGGR